MDRLALNLYIKISLIFLASFFPSMETVVQRTLIDNLSYGKRSSKKKKSETVLHAHYCLIQTCIICLLRCRLISRNLIITIHGLWVTLRVFNTKGKTHNKDGWVWIVQHVLSICFSWMERLKIVSGTNVDLWFNITSVNFPHFTLNYFLQGCYSRLTFVSYQRRLIPSFIHAVISWVRFLKGRLALIQD